MNNLQRKELVACYVRVSSQEQKLHGFSLDAQRDKLKLYAEQHDLIIYKWYEDEGVSGRKLIKNRPALQRLIQDGEQHKFDRIIFIKLDRFFRSVAEYHEAMKRLDGIPWTATEEKYDLSTASGRTFVNMKLAIAELEADQTGERIRMVNEYKVKTGQPMTGNPHYGWMVVGERGSKRVVIDPDKEAHVRFCIEHMLITHSMRSVALKSNENWGQTWDARDVKWLLQNPMLWGHYRGNDHYCEAYITRAEFDDLQKTFNKGLRLHAKTNRTYLFAGMLICPSCGRKLSGFASNCRYGSYKRYRCRFNSDTHICGWGKSVSEHVLEMKLLENIKEYADQSEKHEYEIYQVEKKKPADIQARIERLNYMFELGRISVDEYDRKYKELKDYLKPTEHVNYDKIQELLRSDWKTKYESLDEPHKQAFWQNLIDKIILDENHNIQGIEWYATNV